MKAASAEVITEVPQWKSLGDLVPGEKGAWKSGVGPCDSRSSLTAACVCSKAGD